MTHKEREYSASAKRNIPTRKWGNCQRLIGSTVLSRSHQSALSRFMVSKLSVLVVEHDSSQRELVAELLRLDGHEVMGVDDDRLALERLALRHYDVIVIGLAATAGVANDFAAEVRAQHDAPQVILVSALPVSILQEQVPGCAHYLQRPFHPDALSWIVGECASSTKFAVMPWSGLANTGEQTQYLSCKDAAPNIGVCDARIRQLVGAAGSWWIARPKHGNMQILVTPKTRGPKQA